MKPEFLCVLVNLKTVFKILNSETLTAYTWNGLLSLGYLQVTEKSSKNEKLIVRGYARCEYHGDVLDETEKELGPNYDLKCLGGGRIKHEAKNHNILVYGYSQVSSCSLVIFLLISPERCGVAAVGAISLHQQDFDFIDV